VPRSPVVDDADAWPALPRTNRAWNSTWLAITEADTRRIERRRPARGTQTAVASTSGTRMPSNPGTSPPPATCDSNATKVDTIAASAPRKARAERVEVIRPFSQDLDE
jgi:hypothetical protein